MFDIVSWFKCDHKVPPKSEPGIRHLLREVRDHFDPPTCEACGGRGNLAVYGVSDAKCEKCDGFGKVRPKLDNLVARIDKELADDYEPEDHLTFVLMDDYGLDSIDACDLVEKWEPAIKKIQEKQA